VCEREKESDRGMKSARESSDPEIFRFQRESERKKERKKETAMNLQIL
jgi:hypothetical protein